MRFTGDERSLNYEATERMPRQLLQPSQRDMLAGRYEVTSRIGRGRTTEVFAAYDHQLERVVAIKQARDDVPGETVTSERLRKEALALATIESPHVAAIYDIGCGDRGVFQVMQRLNGRTLDEEIERNGPADPARGGRLVHDVLSGLAALHASGWVHGDLKASNILLDRHDHAVLIDLGAAMLPHAGRQPPASGIGDDDVEATPLEPAPVDGRADLRQVGQLLIYLVTGDLVEPPIEPSRLVLPLALRGIIERALAPLGSCFGSALQMQQAIDEVLVTAAAAALDPVDPSSKATRRWPALPRP